MPWSSVEPELRELARRVLTPRQQQAWFLAQEGYGHTKVGRHLDIDPSAVRDLLERAERRLRQAGAR